MFILPGGNSGALPTLDFKLLCYERANGNVLWQQTAVVAKPHQETHSTNGFASASPCTDGQTSARSYDLETGKELWRCAGQTERPAASAVASDGLVFVGSAFRGSFLAAFRLGGKGDIQGTSNVAWSVNRDTPDIASPLLSSGRLYFYKARAGILTCVDAATGKTAVPADSQSA